MKNFLRYLLWVLVLGSGLRFVDKFYHEPEKIQVAGIPLIQPSLLEIKAPAGKISEKQFEKLLRKNLELKKQLHKKKINH